MNSRFVPGILFMVLAAGCLAAEIQTGNPAEYEFPGINDTTIYYLNSSSVAVVDSVVNSTSARYIIGESGEMDFKNPVAVDYSGKNVTFNITRETVLGRSYARFDFSPPFSGFVAYTQPDGQDFMRMLFENKSIRFVLPVNFTTGSRFLGIAQPEPDNITVDAKGREVLIWKNPYPEYKSISVKYYHRSSPIMLIYLMLVLFIAGLMMFAYYSLSMRALRKRRELMEKGIRK